MADLLNLIRRADHAMESCLRRRLDLRGTMASYLPVVCRLMGADGALVRAKSETHQFEIYAHGKAVPAAFDRLSHRRAVVRRGATTWVVQPLDVAGLNVGRAAFRFTGAAAKQKNLAALVDAACEQMDMPLWVIQTASFKQELIEKITSALTLPVFDEALHDAVAAFRRAARFDRLAVVYHNGEVSDETRLLYRVYNGSTCVAARGRRDHPGLERALRRHGTGVLAHGSSQVAEALGFKHHLTWQLKAGVHPVAHLGAVIVSAPDGLDSVGRDLLHVFCNAVSQRLVDYARERRNLAQFFSPEVIDELVQDPNYKKNRLMPLTARAGIIYADINSFTKLCERALIAPEKIGSFVDRWSGGAVRLLWKRKGVFDKMVGDCVIGHFGPPFYRDTTVIRARAALDSAFEIQAFTKSLEREPEFRSLARKAGIPGLGVSVGVNLCPASIGLFGPNQDLTAFSRGMNETARLQSHAGFREIVAMESVVKAVRAAKMDKGLRFEGPLEAAVKNVNKPLRYYRVTKR